jgi:hypothetical protein
MVGPNVYPERTSSVEYRGKGADYVRLERLGKTGGERRILGTYERWSKIQERRGSLDHRVPAPLNIGRDHPSLYIAFLINRHIDEVNHQ